MLNWRSSPLKVFIFLDVSSPWLQEYDNISQVQDFIIPFVVNASHTVSVFISAARCE